VIAKVSTIKGKVSGGRERTQEGLSAISRGSEGRRASVVSSELGLAEGWENKLLCL
jgi:hypothetical protein